jgi:AraC-like DNA-binding protein
LLTHRLRSLRSKVPNPLAREEIVVQALSTSMKAVPPRSAPTRTVERTKQWLHAHLAEPISLDEVAGAMGVSPVYLTQEFTRSEGIPLYRYQLRLRLARSLTELPHCEDITALALDLGFSSHSHFGAVFKATFGLTPSQFRSATSERSSAVLEMAWPNARIPS